MQKAKRCSNSKACLTPEPHRIQALEHTSWVARNNTGWKEGTLNLTGLKPWDVFQKSQETIHDWQDEQDVRLCSAMEQTLKNIQADMKHRSGKYMRLFCLCSNLLFWISQWSGHVHTFSLRTPWEDWFCCEWSTDILRRARSRTYFDNDNEILAHVTHVANSRLWHWIKAESIQWIESQA